MRSSIQQRGSRSWRITKTWQQIRGETGKKCRLHDLRHAHATFLLESGAHLKVVQQRLGRSSITVTADTYAHVSPGMDKEAANAFANAMRDPVKMVTDWSRTDQNNRAVRIAELLK